MYTRLIRPLFIAGTLLLLSLSLLALPPGGAQFMELLSHFKVHLALSSAVTLLLAALLRLRLAVAVAALALLIDAAAIVPLWLPADPPAADGPTLHLLSFNVLRFNKRYDATRAYIRREAPDLVLLFETTYDWSNALLPLHEDYPYRYEACQWGYFGIVLLSRYPLDTAELHFPLPSEIPVLRAVVQTPGGPLGLLAVHPPSPPDADEHRARDRLLAALPTLAAPLPPDRLIVGDLNTTSFSPVFGQLLRATGLRDSRQGYGVQSTFPSRWVPLGITLDHVLHSPGMAVADRSVGPALGSDHRPVSVRLRLP
ncbi:MAG: hypothetical protein OHK0039_16690 [Bacteroidia bacterium]